MQMQSHLLQHTTPYREQKHTDNLILNSDKMTLFTLDPAEYDIRLKLQINSTKRAHTSQNVTNQTKITTSYTPTSFFCKT